MASPALTTDDMPKSTTANRTVERAGKAADSAREPKQKVTAETMAARQRDISVSEFFAKNRHLLGFDNPRKALLTTVKEAVDNSLDACEEAGILPDITVVIEDLQPDRGREVKSSRYRITIVDNGPGIVRHQVEHIFGRLLYGSKFHRLKMSRGQQGIGISAAGMYGLITTGKPMLIQTRPKASKPAHHIELAINTKTNRAEVTLDEETEDFPLQRIRVLTPSTRELSEKNEFLSQRDFPTGTSVTIELEGKYQRGRGSVDEFLELTAIANPHAKFTFVRPTRESAEEEEPTLLRGKKAAEALRAAAEAEKNAAAAAATSAGGSEPAKPKITEDYGDLVVFPRAVNELPPETKEIQPHPKGVELGTLLQMLKDYEQAEKGGTLYNFLQEKFCRVSPSTAGELCTAAGKKVTSRTKVADIEPENAEALYKGFQEVKLLPPPTDCLAPIGVRQLLAGMLKGVRAEFYAASSREAAIYRGRPFLIEAAIAFGGELPADDSARVIRFANRVPLLFQQSACSSFKAVTETSWKNYNLQQPRGSLPVGPLVIMIHMASVWVPFTSESKEAIADYDEIRKEMKLALMECGRKLGTYLRKRQAMRRQSERRDVFERYIGEISQAVQAINGTDAKKLYEALLAQAKKHTAIADMQLDEDGRAIKEDPADQDGVIIVEDVAAGGPATARADEPPTGKLSKAEAAALKVASLAKGDDEDQPKLMDVAEPKRLDRKGKAPEKPARKTKHEGKGAPKQPEGKAAKPKMRLVNGKLIPADERLF
ncbi:MAG TPA: DNA topoisomerase VI subunit B [Phycisphaerales bacterium]|nr:DNA topoisomerase VI subunit B [Phycisphaerales bacterium]